MKFLFPLAGCIYVQSTGNGEKHLRRVLFVDIGYFCSGRKIPVKERVFFLMLLLFLEILPLTCIPSHEIVLCHIHTMVRGGKEITES